VQTKAFVIGVGAMVGLIAYPVLANHVSDSPAVQVQQAIRDRPVFDYRLARLGPNLMCSPAPCVFPNSQASSGSKPANETPIVADPKNPLHLLVGANDFNCPRSPQQLYALGYYASGDGGATWTRTCGTVLPGSGNGGADPIVAYDLNGIAWRGGIDAINSTADIIVDRSINNGKTWSKPVIAAPSFFQGGYAGHPWMEVDTNQTSPHRNALYVLAGQFTLKGSQPVDSGTTVSHSTDGGKTWTMVQVGATQRYPNIGGGADLAVGKDGTVYATLLRCVSTSPPLHCANTVFQMFLSKSTDGGNTWSKPVLIHDAQVPPGLCSFGCLPNTAEQVVDYPLIAIDNGTGPNAGALYVADYNYANGYMKVQVATSKDGGRRWSVPVGVAPPSDTHDQFFPALSVSGTGTVGVTWMDRRNDPMNLSYEAFAAISTDGGKTFPNNYQIAAKPSNPHNDGFGGKFLGDYTGDAWAGKALYVAWPDTSNGVNSQAMVGGLLTP
jgi:hypothetical protein